MALSHDSVLGLRHFAVLHLMMIRALLTGPNLQVRVMVVGLGAGLLPMFLHNHLPVDHIEVRSNLPLLTVELLVYPSLKH